MRTYLGLAGFVIAAITADLVNPPLSPVEVMVSHLVHARAGWLIPLALLSLAAASASLWWRLRGTKGSALLGVWTAGVLVGAVVPADPYGQWNPSPAGMVHGMAAVVAFAALPAAAVVMRRHPILPVVTCLTFAVTFLDVLDGPDITFGGYESLVGLTERLALFTYVGWLALAAYQTRARLPTCPARLPGLRRRGWVSRARRWTR